MDLAIDPAQAAVLDPVPDMPQDRRPDPLAEIAAKQKAAQRGRPRFLGLILTVILLIVLIGVAAFASILNDGGINALLRRDTAPEVTGTDTVVNPPTESAPAQPQLASINPAILEMPAQIVQPPRQPDIRSEAEADTPAGNGDGPADLSTDAPLLALPDDGAGETPGLTTGPETAPASANLGSAPDALDAPEGLTDTDTAVLDALRDIQTTDPEELADAPLPEDDLASLSEPDSTVPLNTQAANYAITGIWSTVPEHPATPGVIPLDDLFIAAIDGATLTQDALALPRADSYQTDVSPAGVASPAAAGIAFELDALGLVDPTPEGTTTPDGIIVYLGQPAVVPPPTPPRIETAEAEDPLQPNLPDIRPRGRPGDLVENAERARLGGLTVSELGGVRPLARPYEPAPPEPEVDPAAETETETAQAAEDAPQVNEDGDAFIPLSPAEMRLAAQKPKIRPSNFARTIARAQAAEQRRQRASTTAGPAAAASTASAAATTTAPATTEAAPSTSNRSGPAVPRNQTARPTGPTPASVAKQATIKNAINLRQVNLIGVYGTPSNRRALVRLSSGRYKKVQVGDRIDGGQIVAIGDSELRYRKSGRNVVLRMPRG